MKLVVGLGNPGRKYEGTRHNVGFECLAELARRLPTAPVKRKFEGELIETDIGGQRVLLLCPHTYMNLSGSSVLAARDFYKVADEDLLVVCDDFHLPTARLRFRSRGSAGGQKGLADIIRRLGTDQFARLRIGVGSPPPEWDAADYVLSRFQKDEKPLIAAASALAADGVIDWVGQGIAHCMNHYNAG